MLSFAPFAMAAVLLYLMVTVSIGAKRKTSVRRQILMLVFFVYLLVVVSITLFPIPLHQINGLVSQNNLIPFKTIRGVLGAKSISNDLYNLGGNILLFVPFGFLLPLVNEKQNRFGSTLALGFTGTLVVESGKFIISSVIGFTYRGFDVDDLILNTLGVMLGYLLLQLFLRAARNPQRFISSRLWFVFGPIISIVIIGSAWAYEYDTHSTPQKALESRDSNALPVVTIPFINGVVLISSTDPETFKQPGYVAWYLEKRKLLGWQVIAHSLDALSEAHLQQSRVSFATLVVSGETLVWGTQLSSGAVEIVYHHGGEVYTGRVNSNGFWHIILPFSQTSFSPSAWSIRLRNGRSLHLFT